VKETAHTRAIRLINQLTHTKGPFAAQPFNLRQWQVRILRKLFTTRKDGHRQYRTCLLMLPRKNGKTELAAALAIYFLLFDGEIGGEIYSAAADKDQAALVFNVAAQMIRNDHELYAQVEIIDSQKRIVHRKSGSFYRAISAEAYSKHGFNASVVIYDELHAAPDGRLWDVLRTSQSARAQPLMLAISTAGFDRQSVLWKLYEHAKRVEAKPSIDPTFLAILFEAPMDADWTDEKVWRKANPALGDFRSLEEMQIECARAQLIPADENTFRRLYLNQWTEQESRAIQMRHWDACQPRPSDAELVGVPCYGGLDLGQSDDFCAWARLWTLDDGRIAAKLRFWVPESALQKYPNRPYGEWKAAGLLTVVGDEATDYDTVQETVAADCHADGVREVAYDRRFAEQMAQHLVAQGITMVNTSQGFLLNEALRWVLDRIVDGTLCHGDNKILSWMASNVVLITGRLGERRLAKEKAGDKIDGFSALEMAADRIVRQPKDVDVPADEAVFVV
jgi:phage terminase large subunit-like protein